MNAIKITKRTSANLDKLKTIIGSSSPGIGITSCTSISQASFQKDKNVHLTMLLIFHNICHFLFKVCDLFIALCLKICKNYTNILTY